MKKHGIKHFNVRIWHSNVSVAFSVGTEKIHAELVCFLGILPMNGDNCDSQLSEKEGTADNWE